MEYLLIKPPWVQLVKDQHWFYTECTAYPVNDDTPAFLIGAYFIPEYRIKEHDRFANIYLGAYEMFAFIAIHDQHDYLLHPIY